MSNVNIVSVEYLQENVHLESSSIYLRNNLSKGHLWIQPNRYAADRYMVANIGVNIENLYKRETDSIYNSLLLQCNNHFLIWKWIRHNLSALESRNGIFSFIKLEPHTYSTSEIFKYRYVALILSKWQFTTKLHNKAVYLTVYSSDKILFWLIFEYNYTCVAWTIIIIMSVTMRKIN